MTERERLVAILRELDLPKGQWCLTGSGVMVLHGLERPRAMGDVDMFLATRPWFMMEHTRAWQVFTPQPSDRASRCDPPYLFREMFGLEVNIFFHWRNRGVGNIDGNWIIYNAQDVDGWPCCSLQFMLDWKRQMGRAKDRDDIQILENVPGLE